MAWWSSARRSTRKFRQLPWRDRWLLAQAALLLLPAAKVAKRIMRWTPDLEDAPPVSAADIPADVRERARAAVRMVRLATRYGPVRGNCMERSIATRWVLRRHGIPAAIRIGVCRENGRLEAHAWVECGGVVVDGDAQAGTRFQPLPATIGFRGLHFS